MDAKEIGASLATISKITTTIDGGARITIDLDPSSSELAAKLLTRKLTGRERVMVAFVDGEE